ncbi:MAG: ABC transporter permease subunit [Burkholderiales bacterium]|nr:ABC transporter permease subunit [Burkholderiales bacterium]
MRGAVRTLVSAALVALALAAAPASAETLRVGSKRFTESYILGEVVLQAAERAGVRATHKAGLGGTGIVFAALEAGAIDLYPEYTGTIAREILGLEGNPSIDELNAALATRGLAVGVPLGFNNTYALAMRERHAQALGVRTISDLARHPDVRLGLGPEFIARPDGWPGVKAAYGLPHPTPPALDHGLAYEAIAAGRIDVMDIYSTDAKIARFGLRVLADDRGFFPQYDAVLLHRHDVPERFPAAWRALQALEGRIDAERMIKLNAAAEIEGRTFAAAARLVFDDAPADAAATRGSLRNALFGGDLGRLTREHLVLVFASLAAAVLTGVPLGVVAAKAPAIGQAVMAAVGVIQTVPALALFAFLIAVMGTIGVGPALVALFLYALLPIVRNTHAGIAGIRRTMREAALALGLGVRDRLLLIELPLAAPAIVAGVKTSAVINVGTATIAAFIGAGGYGERIVQGLALNDTNLMLAGALPAAALAILAQAVFEVLERWASPVARAGVGS